MDKPTQQSIYLLGRSAATEAAMPNGTNSEGSIPIQHLSESKVHTSLQEFGYPALRYHRDIQQQVLQQNLSAYAGSRLLQGAVHGNFNAFSFPPVVPRFEASPMLAQQLQAAYAFPVLNNLNKKSSPGDAFAENGIVGPWSATSAGLLGGMASSASSQAQIKKVRKKPKDKPKRPLSAYNIFFKEERSRILAQIPEETRVEEEAQESIESRSQRKRKKSPHGKIGFENLAKVIGQRWQELIPEQVERYKKKANEDMERYKDEMEAYLAKRDSVGTDCNLDLNEPVLKKPKLDPA